MQQNKEETTWQSGTSYSVEAQSRSSRNPTYTLLFHCEYRTNADAQTRGNAMEAAYNEMKLAAIAEGGEIVKRANFICTQKRMTTCYRFP